MEIQEQIVRKVAKTGNGAHVFVSREWIGEEVIIVRTLKGDVKEKILEVIGPYLDKVIGVYLYGSYAREESDGESDIDILVICNEKLKIKKKGFEIICLKEEDIEKALKISPLLLYGALAEAKPIINSSLLESLKNKYVIGKKEIGDYVRETRNVIEVNRVLLDPYSLILRLRGIYIINCLVKDKIARNSDFKKWVLKNVRDLDYGEVYGGYRRYKLGRKIGNVNERDLVIVLNFLENEVDRLEKEINGEKRKKA